MKLKRFLSLGVLILILLSSALAVLPTSHAMAANDTLEKDMERRKLYNLKKCLTYGGRSNRNIDVRRDYDDPNDPIGNTIDDDNVILGLDMNPKGHQDCTVSIIDGINVLFGNGTIESGGKSGEQKDRIGTWLIKYLTGKSFGEDNTVRKKDESGWSKKLDELISQAQARMDEIGKPSDSVLQARFSGILTICYDAYPIGSAPKALSGDNGFQVDGVGVFFRKKGSDVFDDFIKPNTKQDNSRIYKANDGTISSTKVELGSIDLEQTWDGFAREIFGDNGWGHFYPIGGDLDYIDTGNYHGDIAECEVVERDEIKAFLFKDAVVNTDGTLLSTITNSSIPNGAAPSTEITDEEDPESCESSMDGFTGLWVCPMLTGADKLITATEGIIEKKLQVNTEFTSNEGLHDAWTQLARISSALLVIVALVMIVSTALGFDLVSSYTLKKMLPRIVIGAIGIWLSWALATTYIGFMNDLGRGISGIMFEPFKNLYTDVSSFSDVNLRYIASHSFSSSDALTDNTAGLVFTGAFVVFIVTHGGLFAILSAGLTVIIAMLIGLFLLALREVLIVFLLIMAPIAVASWMLPNTNKGWKLWSGTFNKLLLLYPLFMGAFTAGKIFALISAQSTEGNNGVIEVLIPMIAYVSPFFFLPALFKLAGGVFNNITGAVTKGTGFADKWKAGLQKQKDANKAVRKEAGDRLARIRMAEGNATLRDRARLGFGRASLKPGARSAYELERARLRVQGHKDSLETQMLAGGVAEHGARIQAENFNAPAAIAKLTAAEAKQKAEAATAELSKGLIGGVPVGSVTLPELDTNPASATYGLTIPTTKPFDYSNASHLEHIFNTSTDRAVQTAAFSQLVRVKNDKSMRNIMASHRAGTLSQQSQDIVQEAMADGSVAEAFFKKAPDIITGTSAYDSIPAPQTTVEWSKDTWVLAINAARARGPAQVAEFRRMLESQPTATASLDSAKKAAIQTALGGRPVVFARPVVK